VSIDVKGYAALKVKEKLVPYDFKRRTPREDDVVIEILYCGVCHSDLHQVNNDWGGSTYPIVPGHEIIGKIIEVGEKVSRFKVGDAVGVGCMVDSCQHCDPCKNGLEQFCDNAVFTYNSIDPVDNTVTYGGYSTKVVVNDKFVLKIPSGLELKKIAPILCAGITTWSPLRHWNVGKGSKVAVVGLGGLGHMAIKLAKNLGADVSLFSRSEGKEADAKALGAHEVIISTNSQQMAKVKRKFDLIIDTVPYDHDLNPYIETLNVDGTLVLVGYIGSLESDLNSVPLVLERKAVAGSIIGGIRETQELLDFCGEHNIHAEVEVINMQDIGKAYERMLKSDIKYRFVIDMASLKN
jgi:uncharacterized zinc-type alcohol dehydrogenase-like protein